MDFKCRDVAGIGGRFHPNAPALLGLGDADGSIGIALAPSRPTCLQHRAVALRAYRRMAHTVLPHVRNPSTGRHLVILKRSPFLDQFALW